MPECPLCTWRILHKHKASKHVKQFKCNFESGSTIVVVHIERVLNVYGQGLNWPVHCAECTYVGSVKVYLH